MADPVTEANKDVVRRVEAAWQANDFDTLRELISSDSQSFAAVPFMPPGLEGAMQAHREMQACVPDRLVEIEDIFGEGELVVARCRFTGTNLGGMWWVDAPANGSPIDVTFISVYRVVDGRVVEHRAWNDMLALIDQVGADPDLIRRRVMVGAWPFLCNWQGRDAQAATDLVAAQDQPSPEPRLAPELSSAGGVAPATRG
jgi:predicted ester cyclase